jgi:hypothetical protein
MRELNWSFPQIKASLAGTEKNVDKSQQSMGKHCKNFLKFSWKTKELLMPE